MILDRKRMSMIPKLELITSDKTFSLADPWNKQAIKKQGITK
jgi:hypothetical protein